MTGICDKVVLITGGSSGIGAAVADHLASIGYKKLVLVARREKELTVVADKCKAKGATNVLILLKDLLKPEHCAEVISETISKFGRLDVLIGNAGIALSGGTDDFTLNQWEMNFSVNVTANFLLTKHALRHLRKTKGSIVFTASIVGTIQFDSMPCYSASKAAIIQFAKCVARDEARNGVRVNTVSPGIILDELSMKHVCTDDSMDLEAKKEFARKALGGCQPLGRIGEVEDMAQIFGFLISEANSFMTGSNIVSDGGTTLEPPKF